MRKNSTDMRVIDDSKCTLSTLVILELNNIEGVGETGGGKGLWPPTVQHICVHICVCERVYYTFVYMSAHIASYFCVCLCIKCVCICVRARVNVQYVCEWETYQTYLIPGPPSGAWGPYVGWAAPSASPTSYPLVPLPLARTSQSLGDE